MNEEIGIGRPRKVDSAWQTKEKGLSEEFWNQRAGNFRKYNSRVELGSHTAASKKGLYIPKHQD